MGFTMGFTMVDEHLSKASWDFSDVMMGAAHLPDLHSPLGAGTARSPKTSYRFTTVDRR